MDDQLSSLIERASAAHHDVQPNLALGLYQQAAQVARLSHDAAKLAHCLRHISELSREKGDISMALSAGLEATALYRALRGDSLGLANALRVTALAHGASNRDDLATPCWSEARRLYAELGIAPGVNECDGQLSRIARG